MGMTTEVIGFDGLSTEGSPVMVPNGYEGLDWANIGSIPSAYEADQGQTGYVTDHRSGDAVGAGGLKDPATISSAQAFGLDSGYFAAAWDDQLRVEFDGYSGGVLVARRVVKLDPTQTFLSFGHAFKHLDSLVIVTSHGHHAPDVIGSGRQFAMEDVTVELKGHASPTYLHVEAAPDLASSDPAWHGAHVEGYVV